MKAHVHSVSQTRRRVELEQHLADAHGADAAALPPLAFGQLRSHHQAAHISFHSEMLTLTADDEAALREAIGKVPSRAPARLKRAVAKLEARADLRDGGGWLS